MFAYIIFKDSRKATGHNWIIIIVLMVIIWVTGVLGLLNVTKALISALAIEQPINNTILISLASLSLLITIAVGFYVVRKTKN